MLISIPIKVFKSYFTYMFIFAQLHHMQQEDFLIIVREKSCPVAGPRKNKGQYFEIIKVGTNLFIMSVKKSRAHCRINMSIQLSILLLLSVFSQENAL